MARGGVIMGSRYLPVKLDEILHGKAVEWERLEFKAGWNPKAVLHTLCAFANDFHNLGGGYIVLGVEERNGTPVLPPTGLETGDLDAIQKELLNLGENDIRPKYHPTLIPFEVSGRMVAILWVPGGQSRPYKARTNLGKDEREFAYYIRKGSSTVKAAGADEQELMGLTATVPFDDRINQRARVSDLSTALVGEYLEVVGSDLA